MNANKWFTIMKGLLKNKQSFTIILRDTEYDHYFKELNISIKNNPWLILDYGEYVMLKEKTPDTEALNIWYDRIVDINVNGGGVK